VQGTDVILARKEKTRRRRGERQGERQGESGRERERNAIRETGM
jgi:hypothetical protein